jgi:hypothetical protein
MHREQDIRLSQRLRLVLLRHALVSSDGWKLSPRDLGLPFEVQGMKGGNRI